MLDKIFGIDIWLYYVLGIVLLAVGVLMIWRSGRFCYQSIKKIHEGGTTTGKCRRSLRDLGAFSFVLIIYAIALFFLSIYILVYGFQNGWGNVEAIDMTIAIGYLIALIGIIII